MLEETLTEQPNFFALEGYTYYYYKQKLRDFNGEIYDIGTGLSESLIDNNPELYSVIEYFAGLVEHLDVDEDIRDKALDTLDAFLVQIAERQNLDTL